MKSEWLHYGATLYIIVLVALGASSPAVCAELRAQLREQLLEYEFPSLAELPSTYPKPSESETAQFRVQLYREFMGLANSEISEESLSRLGAYLDVRDQWLQEQSVVQCVFAGMITMATDELLIEFAKKVPNIDSRYTQELSDVGSRNNLTGRRLFQAVDRILGGAGLEHQQLVSFCVDETIEPRASCWISYLQQFGLSYQRVTLGDNSVRFLDSPVGLVENAFARAGFFEKVSSNAVFVVCMKEPMYIVQFVTRVIDYNRLRRFVWKELIESYSSDGKIRGIREVAKALDALGPAGERWLAIESYSSNPEDNLDLLARTLNPGMRESLLATVGEDDVEKYRKLMKMARTQ